MGKEKMDATDLEVSEPASALQPFEWEPRALTLSARAGAWGLLVGLGGVLIDTIYIGAPWPFLIPLAGIGLILGGVGTTLTSGLVLRRVGRTFRRLTLAAAVGIPFGLACTAMGIKVFLPQFLDQFFGYTLSMVLVLSTVLVVLLGIGIVEKLWKSGDSLVDETEDTA